MEFIKGSPVIQQIIWFVIILVVSALIGWVILMLMRLAQRFFERRREGSIVSKFIGSLVKPIFILILIMGLIIGLGSFSFLARFQGLISQVRITIIVIFGIYGLTRLLSVALDWYMSSAAFRRAAAIDEGVVRLIRRIMIGVVWVLGMLILLDYHHIAISPILAGLGIGGLAIALALQPMLSNFFAGTQIVADRMLRVGDFVELEGNLSGYVTDLGWRSTRIRTLLDTLVIIPNSRLSESVITNYNYPDNDIEFDINAAVTYDSDLAYVEKVALQVANEVVQDCDEAVKSFKPWFIFEECGDANINFWIRLKARDRISIFQLKSELIKRLRTRFQQEGIETTLITG
jgi:small-conductance mechanosensitive channel